MLQRLALLLLSLLLLAGCAGQQQEEPWAGHIAPDYEDSDQATPWVWQDGANLWVYQGSRPTPPSRLGSGDGDFEGAGLVLRLKATEELNLSMGRPHTLVVKLLQVDDLAAMDNYRGSSFRLADLMKADATELDSNFVRENRITLSPGQSRTLRINRVKDARHLVILAGYYQMHQDTSLSEIPIPAVANRNPPRGPWWRFWRRYDPAPDQPARLQVWVEFGEEQINHVRARAL